MNERIKLNENFKTRFNYYLKKRGTSMSTLSKSIGVSNSAIHKYSTGENLPTLYTLLKLANFFGVTANDLLYLKESEICNQGNNFSNKGFKKVTGYFVIED